MLAISEKTEIARMQAGEPLLRVGAIWYGADALSTVTRLYYYGNKEIQTLVPIRAESALSFSTSHGPIDTLEIEIIVNYAAFHTHVQRLCAHMQITPVVPVLNPVIAAITQPVIHNKRAYGAYGFTEVNDPDVINGTASEKLMTMYAHTPVQMRIDNLAIETIKGAPRDVRLVLRVTRVLTANIYGDRVTYVRTMEDAIQQAAYISEILTRDSDTPQNDALAAMCGVDAEGMRIMINEMRFPAYGVESGTSVHGTVTEVTAPDIYQIEIAGGRSITVMPYGVESLNSREKLKAFGLDAFASEGYVTGAPGESIKEAVRRVKQGFGLVPGLTTEKRRSVSVTSISCASISALDGKEGARYESGARIHFALITHDYMDDIGNMLIREGHAVESPYYDPRKVPKAYDEARTKARMDADKKFTPRLRASPPPLPSVLTARELIELKKTALPWDMRRSLRQLRGKNTP